MAKLSAYGRKEVARLIRDGDNCQDVMAIMSDRTVLLKAITFQGKKHHSTSWRKVGKIKEGHIDSYIEKTIRMLGYRRK